MGEERAPADAQLAWRDEVTDAELVTLTRSHGGSAQPGWWDRVRPHSLGWMTARLDDGTLVGFVNVAWDGGDHAFLIDTKVRPDHQRRGVGTELVHLAARPRKGGRVRVAGGRLRRALAPFYYDACGFVPTPAGLLHLPGLAADPS